MQSGPFDYRQLPQDPSGIRTSWDGATDGLGRVAILDEAAVRRGLAAARHGRVHSLNWDHDLPNPNPWRPTPLRRQVANTPRTRDDYLERLHLQYSTQWDGLRHIGFAHTFYNGVSHAEVDDPSCSVLGIQAWADHGIVGRGVLLDLVGSRSRIADPFHHGTISGGDLDRACVEQSSTIYPGDILILRTGWIEAYERLTARERSALDKAVGSVGLEPSDEVAAWLFDRGVAAVAADNPAVESMPLMAGFPAGSLHERLIPGLGMPMGELFMVAELANTCRTNGEWDFLFVSAPMNVRGGVGSPANALAIT